MCEALGITLKEEKPLIGWGPNISPATCFKKSIVQKKRNTYGPQNGATNVFLVHGQVLKQA